ncbi:MAG: NAD(P)H-hydrate dehydratase [Dehalococcoidia bacterium]|nr:NAD(P)H-hydrate dehydratase [Dehalococcoidia bacterium]
MKIVTADQMREIEARAEAAGVSTDTLMENAGLAVARAARRVSGPLTGVPILALIGPGNNGADGLVTARHLQRWGATVTAYICRERSIPDPKLDSAVAAGVSVISASDDPGLSRLKSTLDTSHLAIDAILGTGRARPIEGAFRDILADLQDARSRNPRLRLLAMDLPTGLNSDTGDVDPACVPSDITVSLGYPKRGHLTFPGADYTGVLEVADIGIPPSLDSDVTLDLINRDWAANVLPARPSNSHKGTYGRAMIVAGSRNFLGAAYLAASAAGRVGAGLVTIAIPESLVPSVASKAIEPTFLPLPEAGPGIVANNAAHLILDSLNGYSSLLLVCGLGQAAETRQVVEELLLTDASLPPTVVDADGLNTLARIPDWWKLWPTDAIFTPHPGEMARLTSMSARNDRIAIARESASAWKKTVILKGAYTVASAPNGDAMLSPYSNPGLATAGTGDVLAGAIVGLLSQGVSIADAASLGVYLHGEAGERARTKLGDTGMLASDLLPQLPRIIRDTRQTQTIAP